MKTLAKLLLCLLVSVPLFFANAATDNYFVPDAAFRAALKAAYPSCFVADSLMKSCANAATKTSLNVSGKGISSLEGIEHFSNLNSLYCDQNNLTSLPALPAKLTFIDASENCFCATPPVKPNGITQENWIVGPNKSSCIVHITVKEAEHEIAINKSVVLKLGKSLFFDGVDDYFSLGTLPAINTFTIEYWAKPTKIPKQFNFPELKNVLNQWNHLAITKTGNTIQVYQNGLLRVNKIVNNTLTLDSLVVGLGKNKYSGQLNELKIWKTVRTASELKASMDNFNEYTHADLVGAWNMTAHSGTEIKDYSKNGRHGTAYGCVWVNEDNSLSYTWSPKENLSTDKGVSVTFTGTNGGIFDHIITATNKNGCKATKNIKVKVRTPNLLGTSFQTAIEIGEFNSERTQYTHTSYTERIFGLLTIYYSFTLSDSSVISYASNPKGGMYYHRNTVKFYDDKFNRAYPKSYYNYNTDLILFRGEIMPPGKYYMTIDPYNFGLNFDPLFVDVSVTQLNALYCIKTAEKKHPYKDAIVISDATGACFRYSDIRKFPSIITCNEGLIASKLYYRITLDSARVLNINTCGTANNDSWGPMQLYLMDSSLTKLTPTDLTKSTPWDSSQPTNTCIDNPSANRPNLYYEYQLNAGTYYISNSYAGDYIDVHLNVSTNGRSCPSNEVITEIADASDRLDLISLYPNPANGKTSLRIPDLKGSILVSILDVSGKIVENLVATSPQTEIDTDKLNEGVYFVSFSHQNRRVVQKLFVAK